MLAIEVKNIRKVYGAKTKSPKEVLKGVSFEIKKGEFVGLLGPNGAGKTTTINCVVGITDPSLGEIKILGKDSVKDYKKTKGYIGLSPQEWVIDIFSTVYDILYYQAGFFGIIGEERKKKIEEMLTVFNLHEHKEKKFMTLSGGLKRRTVVAKALIHNPEIIILDEPTAGVDVETRKDIWDYMKKLHTEGKTIILTSHYLEEVESMCDRLIMIKKGEVVLNTSMSEALKDGNLEKKYLELVDKA